MNYFSFIFFLIISLNTFGMDNPEAYDSTFLDIEDSLDKRTVNNQFNYNKKINSKIFEDILNDKNNLINPEFKISEYFKPSVKFWFTIYTQFSSNQIVIHDLENVEIVYKLMSFDKIHKSDLNIFTAYHIQKNISLENTKEIKNTLNSLATKNFKKLNEKDLAIIQSLRKANVKVPANKKKRYKLFKTLAKNIRYQSGQKDMILQGLYNYQPYKEFIDSQFINFNLPKELLAISFLESSFNTKAFSKAGASGIWQFIKYTGNIFLPKANNNQDYRNNIFLSTIAALHLLKENKQILKRWDLAITAYNSGTKHLIKAKRKYKKTNTLSLEYILENYNHKHLGFASKNYYSEFLALVYALAYKETLYSNFKSEKDTFKNLNIYLSKCLFFPKEIKQVLNEELNNHFFKHNHKYPRGSIFVSTKILSPNKYFLMNSEDIKNIRPHDWNKLLKKIKCN